MPHVLQVLFLSVFILQVVMHGEESQLPYVGETRQELGSRMSQHRYDTRDPKYRMLYDHFNQPGHDR
jgi:hypothetical protein